MAITGVEMADAKDDTKKTTNDYTSEHPNPFLSQNGGAVKDEENKGDCALETTKGDHSNMNGCSEDVEKKIEISSNVDELGLGEIGFSETWFSKMMGHVEDKVYAFLNKHSTLIKLGTLTLFLTAYFVFYGFCMNHRFGDEGSIMLTVITIILVWKIFKAVMASKGHALRIPRKFILFLTSSGGKRYRTIIGYSSYVIAMVSIVTYLAVDIFPNNITNLQSFFGMIVMIFICFIFSAKPSRVNWHPVFWAFVIQFVVAFLTLRTQVGYDIFKWLGDAFETLFNFSDAGSAFVIGPEFKEWGLALSTSGVIIFTNAFIFLLNHWGVIESIVLNLGGFLSFCLETGPVESVVAAANIFIGLAEAPLMVRPYLPNITKSEIHAIMTCGFASISGGVMGLFIRVGAPANHLLTAAVISAPAALAVSKLLYPEMEKVCLEAQTNIRMSDRLEKSTSLNAFSEGAVVAVDVCVAMWSNMLAFVSAMALLDAVALWCGDRIGVEDLTFGLICSYVLFPLSIAMGIDISECKKFGALMGVKMFATPFVAYKDLGVMIDNREVLEDYKLSWNDTTWYWQGNDVFLEGTNTTLVGGVLTRRSEVIATYAMCGLNAFPAIGMTLGALVPLCPDRKPIIVDLIIRAFIAGNIACFITAAVAGILYTTEDLS